MNSYPILDGTSYAIASINKAARHISLAVLSKQDPISDQSIWSSREK
jgi:hypothetical protein